MPFLLMLVITNSFIGLRLRRASHYTLAVLCQKAAMPSIVFWTLPSGSSCHFFHFHQFPCVVGQLWEGIGYGKQILSFFAKWKYEKNKRASKAFPFAFPAWVIWKKLVLLFPCAACWAYPEFRAVAAYQNTLCITISYKIKALSVETPLHRRKPFPSLISLSHGLSPGVYPIHGWACCKNAS